MLNPRGRFLYDFFLYQNAPGEILLECNPIYKENLLNSLNLYNLHKKVRISEVNYYSYISLKENYIENTIYTQLDPRSSKLGYKIITEEKLINDQKLFNKYELIRIKNCIPDCSVDLISGRSFPLEYGLGYAFSFSKGCYVGQEVTMRFKLQNQLKRKIFLIYSEDEFPAPHSDLKYNGDLVGKILSHSGNYALAFLEVIKLEKINSTSIQFDEVNVSII